MECQIDLMAAAAGVDPFTVYDATGVRLYALPMTRARVKAAIAGKSV